MWIFTEYNQPITDELPIILSNKNTNQKFSKVQPITDQLPILLSNKNTNQKFSESPENPFSKGFFGQILDKDADGFPDEAELITEDDRSSFRRWFVTIAESQFYSLHNHWPDVRRDCTGLICFAYKEALKSHDKEWLNRFRYITNPAIPDVRAFHYPDVPVIKTDLFRTLPGPFVEKDLENGVFQPVATAKVLMQYNCRFIGKELDDSAADGDLLFFRYDVDEKVVYHAMILIRKLPGSRGGDRDDNDNDEEEEPDGLLVYHTGPEGSQTGEVRKLRISTLNRHPDDIWHVKPGNPHFLGFFRLNILEFNLVSLSVNRSSQDSRNLALREGFFQRGFYLNGGRIK